MSPQYKTIGGKQVLLSQPYAPRVVPGDDFQGRQAELEIITAAWMARPAGIPLSPLLLSPPGLGKNRTVYEVAHRTGKELYIFLGHDDVTAEEIACSVRFSDDAARRMDYVLSPLATAMVQGGICFLDELGKLRPRATAPLLSVLDERRYLDSITLGERIYAHPGFRFIAATNSADLDGASIPECLRSRIKPVIDIGPSPRSEIEAIVRTRFFPVLNAHSDVLLNQFWRHWGKRGESPTPRDAVLAFSLALNYADWENAGGLAGVDGAGGLRVETESPAESVHPRHLERSLEVLFSRGKEARK